jgi:transposase
MMRLTEDQYEVIRPLMPVQRGNVRITNLDVLNAVLYVAENGCKWRGLPKGFGNWHTIYTRLRRWAAAGVLERVFQALQEHRLIRIRVECVGLDSTSVKVHPDGTGALKKKARKPLANRAAAGPPRFIWLLRMNEWP